MSKARTSRSSAKNIGSKSPIESLRIVEGDQINAIVEAAKGSRNKYKYDPDTGLFVLHKLLPVGMFFPYDFGFIPATKAEDGDPLDVLILMDEPTFCGCQVRVRLLGVIEAEQKNPDEPQVFRNDRLIGVASPTVLYNDVKKIDDLPGNLMNEVKRFFIAYNETQGRKFKVLRVGGIQDAFKMLVSSATSGKEQVQQLAKLQAETKPSKQAKPSKSSKLPKQSKVSKRTK